ncbi:TetR/AcrR family transcriptional regulator [Rhodococcus sp. CSLK01-03]|uniref:TetR/AcrR family transcriptional regulator n=1 Tax=Rhodococcus indonesiensis TaxID=3055869 RepID=A0ABT7RTB9_9NOCA|nr:TetR/AcrR family transcriptional regulator [Rhodococcus indonesiensis]MDM7490894.1 TetR/AcrR family transcriptional regulator [Rhodococcus indonesiensis]
MTGIPRKEQRQRTRETLLDATIECLVTHGYAGTTTQRIQDLAGVSRGALLHHFGSKSELLVAAIHHTAAARLDRFTRLVAELDEGPEALEQMVMAIREAMAGPSFQAAIELWAASRTDSQLRDALLPAERTLGAALHRLFDQHSGIDDPELARTAFESLMVLVRGLELTRIMRDDPTVDDRIVADWLAGLRARIASP